MGGDRCGFLARGEREAAPMERWCGRRERWRSVGAMRRKKARWPRRPRGRMGRLAAWAGRPNGSAGRWAEWAESEGKFFSE
jgi:hypothetical protein